MIGSKTRTVKTHLCYSATLLLMLVSTLLVSQMGQVKISHLFHVTIVRVITPLLWYIEYADVDTFARVEFSRLETSSNF
jgi:hypothetical protein